MTNLPVAESPTPNPSNGTLDYAPQPMTNYRWVVLGLVFFGTTVNYMDRQVLSVLAPNLRDKYHLITDTQYGYLQGAFALAYGLGQMGAGRWIDWIGTRLGYALSLFAWSVMSILHVVARTAMGFGVMRVLLGVAESPNFPAAVKTLSEWFPRRERAFAMGVVNTGVLFGVILVPATVPFIEARFGWQSAFIVTGVLGVVWLAFWLPIYRTPREMSLDTAGAGGKPRVSAAEMAHIHSDPPEPKVEVRWLKLLRFPQAWAFMIGKFMTDPLWWFYMTWFPNFLKKQHGLNLTKMSLPLIIIYLMASVGSMAGGWLSSTLIKRGWSVNAARKTALLISAIVVTPMIFTTRLESLTLTVALLGLSVAAHQSFSSNLYTLVSDMFPRMAVGSVSGIGGGCGYLAAFFTSILTGYVVDKWTNHNYGILFVIAGSGYLVALLIIQILAPRLEPARLDEVATRGFDVVTN